MTQWLWWIMVILVFYIAQPVAVLLMEHRRQSYLTAWLFIVLVFPFAGFAAYLLLERRLPSRGDKTCETVTYARDRLAYASPVLTMDETNKGEVPGGHERFLRLLTSLSPYPLACRNRSRVLQNGEDTFEAILDAMRKARHHIHVDYYTIRSDGVGDRFLRVLTEKARKGIEVRVLYDGVGSWKLSGTYIERLRRAGVQVHSFAPPRMALLTKRLNYRDHRKIVVVDGLIGFLGGINIGDEYIGLDPKLGYWRDTHLQIQGDAVYSLQDLFMRDWFAAAGEKLTDYANYMPKHSLQFDEPMMIVPGWPGFHERNISEAMIGAIQSAQHHLYAATPYFIPDPGMASSLKLAARSGVDVRLIIPGKSDSKLVQMATLSHAQDMLEAGIRVYRYRKGFIHSKVLTADASIAVVGTANMDMRSFYSSCEAMAVLLGKDTVKRLESDFLNDLKDSEEIRPESYAARSKGRKAAEAAMRILSPLL